MTRETPESTQAPQSPETVQITADRQPPAADLVPDLDADPMAGVPAALIEAVGAYDHDTAGGCG